VFYSHSESDAIIGSFVEIIGWTEKRGNQESQGSFSSGFLITGFSISRGGDTGN